MIDAEQRMVSVARIREQHKRYFRLAMEIPPAQIWAVIMALQFYASKSEGTMDPRLMTQKCPA